MVQAVGSAATVSNVFAVRIPLTTAVREPSTAMSLPSEPKGHSCKRLAHQRKFGSYDRIPNERDDPPLQRS